MSVQALTFMCCALMVQSAHKDRHQQMIRMKNYELLHIEPRTIDDETSLLEFDAFDQHYVVELARKHLSAPSLVVHNNVDSKDHYPLSSNDQSCHFSGKVMNTQESSIVSVSMCESRGLRARITAFGETLIVKPSAYYLDLAKDKLANHSLVDELLVYRCVCTHIFGDIGPIPPSLHHRLFALHWSDSPILSVLRSWILMASLSPTISKNLPVVM